MPVVLLFVAPPANAQSTIKLELGSEVDTNVHRTTTERGAEEVATNARLALRFAGVFRPWQRSALRLSALAAAKLYPSSAASNESVAVLAADGRWDVAFGRVAPGLRLAYYDAADPSGVSDSGSFDHSFRTGSALAALTLGTEDEHRVEASAGGRFFQYKPNPDFDFTGAVLGAALSRRLRSEDSTWELAYAASYTLSQRAYSGPALTNVCAVGAPLEPGCLMVTTIARADLFHDLVAEVTYTRSFILGVRYELQLNDSNSYGQSLLRHRFEVSGTTELFFDIFLNAKVVLIVNQFLDALLLEGDVGTFITIEDEARNAAIVHLTRDLGSHFTLEARAAFYANPFARAVLDYHRETFYLGVVYAFKP